MKMEIDIEDIINRLKEMPHTYSTLLEGDADNPTLQRILRRKMTEACRNGKIFRSVVPNTRFGQVIFYHPKKEYSIIFEMDRIGCHTFCLFNPSGKKEFLVADRCFRLGKGRWERMHKSFRKGQIIKCL